MKPNVFVCNTCAAWLGVEFITLSTTFIHAEQGGKCATCDKPTPEREGTAAKSEQCRDKLVEAKQRAGWMFIHLTTAVTRGVAGVEA